MMSVLCEAFKSIGGSATLVLRAVEVILLVTAGAAASVFLECFTSWTAAAGTGGAAVKCNFFLFPSMT
jgi:hypothetical protein